MRTDPPVIRLRVFDLRAVLAPGTTRLALLVAGEPLEVAVNWTPTRRGQRPWLLCPACEARCAYLVGTCAGELACRRCRGVRSEIGQKHRLREALVLRAARLFTLASRRRARHPLSPRWKARCEDWDAKAEVLLGAWLEAVEQEAAWLEAEAARTVDTRPLERLRGAAR